MSRNWENGLYGCDGCDYEGGLGDFTQVPGGTDVASREVAPGQYELVEYVYGVSLCSNCRKKHDEQVAARLLSW